MLRECSQDSLVVSPHCLPTQDLSHDMVLGHSLDKVKEEVTEEQPSSLWMLEKSKCWIVESKNPDCICQDLKQHRLFNNRVQFLNIRFYPLSSFLLDSGFYQRSSMFQSCLMTALFESSLPCN